MKLAQFRLRIGVVEALHRLTVPDGFKAFGPVVAHPRRGGIGPRRPGSGRMFGFQVLELALQNVVFLVGNLGSCLSVVALIMERDLVSQG